MEVSDDEILESDVEFRELDGDAGAAEQSEANEANRNLEEENGHPEEMGNYPEELFVPEPLCVNDRDVDELKSSSQLPTEEPKLEEEQLTVSDEYLDSIKQLEEAPAPRKGGGGKWKKRTRRNPFISFFLSMYSRRPRQRVAEVARQAGRHWGRMSDRQRKLYAEDLRGFQH